MKLTEIQGHVEQAATAIATLPPEEWPQWVVYLLETLQEKTTSGSFYSVLLDVEDAVSERIKAGQW